MDRFTLIVSNPPHETGFSAEALAGLLGLRPAEARGRAAHTAPEVWLAEEDSSLAASKADLLGRSGLSVFVVGGGKVARVPAPVPLKEFRFEEDAFSGTAGEHEFRIPYGAAVLAVPRTPKFTEGSGTSLRGEPKPAKKKKGGMGSMAMLGGGLLGVAMIAAKEMIKEDLPAAPLRMNRSAESPALDLYAIIEGGPRRLSLVQGVTRFDGLGADKAVSFRRNTAALLTRLASRFARLRRDDRLSNVAYPEPVVSCMAWRRLWTEVSPALGKAGTLDIASRLLFLSYCRG